MVGACSPYLHLIKLPHSGSDGNKPLTTTVKNVARHKICVNRQVHVLGGFGQSPGGGLDVHRHYSLTGAIITTSCRWLARFTFLFMVIDSIYGSRFMYHLIEM